jgi:hypothetical protein
MKNRKNGFFHSSFFCLRFLLRSLRLLVAAGLLEGAAQEELDLPVQGAQIVVRPALDGLQHRWINPQQEWFSVSH